MSSWGSGHFEDDDALDYVGAITDRIAGELDKSAGKKKLSGDEVLSRCIPRLAVLALLVKGTRTPAPEGPRLDKWQAVFQAGFDREAGDMFDEPADAKRKWRAIEKTFVELKKAAIDATE